MCKVVTSNFSFLMRLDRYSLSFQSIPFFYLLKVVLLSSQFFNAVKYDLTVEVNRPSQGSCSINHFVVAVSSVSPNEKTVIQDEILSDTCSVVNGLNIRNSNKQPDEEEEVIYEEGQE